MACGARVAASVKTVPIAAGEIGVGVSLEPTPAFLFGHALPGRWQRRARFAILQSGFGAGHDFLATWAAWRNDRERCERLDFVAIESRPLRAADFARIHAASPLADLARQLVDAWPPATCNLHLREFEGGRVRLLVAFGDFATWARELVASIDAFCFDAGAGAGTRPPTPWDRGVFAVLARLAAPNATAVVACANASVNIEHFTCAGLRTAGFILEPATGSGSTNSFVRARFAPRFRASPPPGRLRPDPLHRHAIVVGAGLAGACTARALARQGIECEVIDRHPEPAAEASGNPAGLFHSAVMGQDGPHARLLRAAALVGEALLRAAIDAGCAGAVDGLLRLESKLSLAAMRSIVDRQALPASHVRAVDAEEATRIAGLQIDQPAFFYPAGGWIDPAAWVRHALATPGVHWRGGRTVARIARSGADWQAIDSDGCVMAAAPLMVLANADGALRLAGLPREWLQRRRGQLSWSARPVATAAGGPLVPLASGGYVLRLADGRLLFGASNDGDTEPQLREADHRGNRARLAALVGDQILGANEGLDGRVGWRAITADRLPLAGAAPDLEAARPTRADAVRMLPRRAGLWLHTGLGSRGLTTAPLCAELIAAQVSGAPWPLEADLADAVDPARLLLRPRRLAGA